MTDFLALIGLCALLLLGLGHPAPMGCVHPTAMPATWYGDCR